MRTKIRANTLTKSVFRKGFPTAVLLWGAAALLGSCSQDESFDPGDGNRVPVAFSTTIAGAQDARSTQPQTRGKGVVTNRGVTSTGVNYMEYVAADGFLTREIIPPGTTPYSRTSQTRTANSGSEWIQGDAVGIFMLTNNGTLPGGIAMGADNIEYRATPGGDAQTATFAPADADKTIYYPQSGTVDFIAYYPYGDKGTNVGQVTNDGMYKISVANQTDPEAIDVLHSNNAVNKAGSKTEPVILEFEHALSRITINVLAGEGIGNVDFSTMTAALKGFPTTANLSLADGTTFTERNGTAVDITPLKVATTSGYKATYEAILIPQSGTNVGRTIVFSLGGTDYIWTLDNDAAFAQGKIHTYGVTIKGVGVAVAGSPTITPWGGTSGDPSPGTVDMVAVRIPKGTFQMGSPGEKVGSGLWEEDANGAQNREKPRHWVKLTQDFYMSKYQVTNAQYAAFLNAAGVGQDGQGAVIGESDNKVLVLDSKDELKQWSVTWNAGKWIPIAGYEDHPVIYVTWYGAKAYADWIGGKLPTEAEWEYACRAGSTLIYSYGDVADDDYMWYYGNSNGTIHKVGEKKANPWGLYDMHGNVLEWCMDWCDGSDNYPTADTEAAAVTDPLEITGIGRVLRGGGWGNSTQYCRSAYRIYDYPDFADNFVGFRVAFVP